MFAFGYVLPAKGEVAECGVRLPRMVPGFCWASTVVRTVQPGCLRNKTAGRTVLGESMDSKQVSRQLRSTYSVYHILSYVAKACNSTLSSNLPFYSQLSDIQAPLYSHAHSLSSLSDSIWQPRRRTKPAKLAPQTEHTSPCSTAFLQVRGRRQSTGTHRNFHAQAASGPDQCDRTAGNDFRSTQSHLPIQHVS